VSHSHLTHSLVMVAWCERLDRGMGTPRMSNSLRIAISTCLVRGSVLLGSCKNTNSNVQHNLSVVRTKQGMCDLHVLQLTCI
jgi:hypothetical protein